MKRRIVAAVLILTPALTQAGPMSTAGQFEVSPTGAASYAIPIAVPPSTAGIEPKLSLVYNSQSGNGLLGVGWSLAGLSAITRCPRTVAQDGVRGRTNYDANDRFCLDGQRLMASSGTYGANGTEYRTERESFSKIISYGTAGNGPAWFKAWTKAGLILEYGSTADSRIEAQGKSTVRVWAINKISDSKGNYLTVAYTEDASNGNYYPARIDYTGNAITGLSANSAVQFVYEPRPDIALLYEAGSVIENTVRLRKVQTYQGATLLAEYQLSYGVSSATQRSRISSITACDGANKCLPATLLGWQERQSGFSANYQTFGFTYPASEATIGGDFNGDGKLDFLRVGTVDFYTYLSNGDGTFYPSYQAFGFTYPSTEQTIAGDFNGDGKTDFAKIGATDFYVYLSNGDGTFLPRYQAFGFTYPSTEQTITGDFDGDGTIDFIRMGTIDFYTYLSGGNGTFYPQYQAFGFAYPSTEQTITGDFDGDGKTDFIRVGTADFYTYLSNGDGTFSPRYQAFGFTYPSTDEQTITGDFNGDGKTDFAQIGATDFYVYLSNGDGTFTSHHQAFGFTYPSTEQTITGDFNGDGKTDFARVGSIDFYTYLSNGDGTFTAGYQTFGMAYGTTTQAVAGDFTGDGQSDFAMVGDSDFYTFAARGPYPDLLIASSSGLGSTSNVAYGPLTNNALYTKATAPNAAIYPQVDIQAPIYVVLAATSSNGVGGVLTQSYTYGGAKAEMGTGRGLLGFAWMKATNTATGIAVRTDYRQDWPYAGLPSVIKKTTASGGNAGLLSQTTYTYGCLNPQLGSTCTIAAGNRYFPYVSQSIESGWDLSGTALPAVTTTNQFDTYGNATQVIVSTSDGISKTTSNTYNNDATNWCLGRLLRSQVQSVAP